MIPYFGPPRKREKGSESSKTRCFPQKIQWESGKKRRSFVFFPGESDCCFLKNMIY